MSVETYRFIKLTVGVLATLGLYSALYRENKFYRFFEHVFLGLAVGYAVVALWTETLYDLWWTKMMGSTAAVGQVATPGYWGWIVLLPIGLLGYFVFSSKNNWVSRIPIGIILGLWSGQQLQVWFTRYGPQMVKQMVPLLPTTSELFHPVTTGMTPAQVATVDSTVYVSQAITNIIVTVTFISVLSYFLFSFDLKNRFLKNATTLGRWLLMIGFGAIFGSTVMMRFTLLIDRMYFVWIEWLMKAILHK